MWNLNVLNVNIQLEFNESKIPASMKMSIEINIARLNERP